MKIEFEGIGREKRVTLKFESREWSRDSLPSIAATWNYLKRKEIQNSVSKIIVDFSSTIWVEVPTLLAIATLVNQVAREVDVEVVFGVAGVGASSEPPIDSRRDEGRLKFLSFLRSMNFFAALPKEAIIKIRNLKIASESYKGTYSPPEFEDYICGIAFQPFIKAITLIPLQVMRAADFHCGDDSNSADNLKIKDVLRKVNENAALNISSAGFHKGTVQRQRILLSIDKILQESLSNVIEHAYGQNEAASYFAFYARIRSPNSTFEGEFKNGLYSSGEEFDHSKDVNWTELYICDLGFGIESQIPQWLEAERSKTSRNVKLIKDLEESSKATNKFLRASRLLFDHSLSRHYDRNTFRSPQTGLQDVKRILMDAGYVDITNCTSVSRRKFTASKPEAVKTARQVFHEALTPMLISDREKDELLAQFPGGVTSGFCEAGTHLVYRSQLSSELPSYNQPGYRSIGWKQAAELLDVYRGDQEIPESHLLFDKRFSPTSQPADQDVLIVTEAIRRQPRNGRVTLFIRLSRNPYKNDVNEWLRLDSSRHGAELSSLLKSKNVSLALEIVDVLPVYAGWLVERIESFANSPWLSDSGLVEVGIFTNLFHYTVFERSDTGYRMNRRKVSKRIDTAISVARALREMDSLSFWNSYPGNSITDVYINEEIEWIATRRKLGEVFSNEFPKIWGYLDFATSLQCLERYRVCERALLRFLAIVYNLNDSDRDVRKAQNKMFLPTIVSSDSMTQRLAKSVQTLFEEVADFNDDALMVLSSVVVTGQTKDRAALGLPNDHDGLSNLKVSFFDRSISKSNKSAREFSLMRWRPPPATKTSSQSTQKRIFRTAEVSPHGALDIRIPHVLERDGIKHESYQRGRAETYADFELLGALKFGHSQKSNRHELINLNLSALVPLSISTSHTSWTWLLNQFYDRERDASSAVVVVYPNQPHAEQIVQEFKHREPLRIPPDVVSFVSAPFLKPRKADPIIVSPRLEQRLSELLGQLRTLHSSQSSPPVLQLKIRIFDAGIVTGRTVRALQQQIESVIEINRHILNLEALDVKFETIALVDRSGQPTYGGLLEKFSQDNRRFWRWDVPSLNENGTCRVCLAIRRIDEFGEQAARSGRDSKRIQLIPKAHSSSLFDDSGAVGDRLHWQDNLSEIQIGRFPQDLQKVIFGYYGDAPNNVLLVSALQYIATFAELTRLLHRSDIALNRAMELKNVDDGVDGSANCLSILLLASHLLLFCETFDKFERVNYAVEIFGLLVDFEADWGERNAYTLANYYGLLALYALEADDLDVLKGSTYYCEWLRRKPLKNPHLMNYIRDISGSGLPFPALIGDKEKGTKVWLENLQRLGSDSTSVVERLMDLLGNERLWHSGNLYNGLALSGITHSAVQGDFKSVRDLVSEAQSLGIFRCPDQALKIIEQQAKKSDNVPIGRHEKQILREILEDSPDNLRAEFFKSLYFLGQPSSNEPAWSGRNATKKLLLMMLSSDGDGIQHSIRRLNSTPGKGNSEKVNDLFEYIGIDSASGSLPFDERVFLVPSREGRGVVLSAVQNIRHASRKIANPFQHASKSDGKFFAWARLFRDDQAVVLSFANFCEQDPRCDIDYSSRFPSFFSEANLVEVSYSSSTSILRTNVKFNKLVRR